MYNMLKIRITWFMKRMGCYNQDSGKNKTLKVTRKDFVFEGGERIRGRKACKVYSRNILKDMLLLCGFKNLSPYILDLSSIDIVYQQRW